MTVSSSHNEYVGEGYYVRIQHCEHRDADGNVCDAYLGVNYPDRFCHQHRKEASASSDPVIGSS